MLDGQQDAPHSQQQQDEKPTTCVFSVVPSATSLYGLSFSPPSAPFCTVDCHSPFPREHGELSTYLINGFLLIVITKPRQVAGLAQERPIWDSYLDRGYDPCLLIRCERNAQLGVCVAGTCGSATS